MNVKVEAVALVYECGNFSEAARQMAECYPERPPSRQLITRWFKQVAPEAYDALSAERKEVFESGIVELGDKARDKLYAALDDMPSGQLPIAAGISIDKALRLGERRPTGGNQLNVQFNLVTRE
jgi:hypothetical protein